MTVDLVNEFTATVASQTTVLPYGDGHVMTLPWSLGDGESVSLLVRQVDQDLFLLSDRGLAADSLALAGVDLDRPVARASWNAVLKSVHLTPSALSAATTYELSYLAERGALGQAMTALAEAVLRADGLRALSSTRPARAFREKVIRSAANQSLAVVPDAPLPTRFGGTREVTCRITGASSAWVQALSAGGNVNEHYDHVRSLFSDADNSVGSLVVVVADDAKLKSWQQTSLRELSKVVMESDQDAFFKSLAA